MCSLAISIRVIATQNAVNSLCGLLASTRIPWVCGHTELDVRKHVSCTMFKEHVRMCVPHHGFFRDMIPP